MADKKYITAPLAGLAGNVTSAVLDFYRQVAALLNSLQTDLATAESDIDAIQNMPSYVDNAAAVAGGLAAGDFFYNTTGNYVSIVQ